MILYHVSFSVYNVGKTYTACNPTFYHLKSIERNVGWINEILDKHRPDGYPSRIGSFYACSELTNCKAYIGNKRIENRDPFYYQVEMNCEIGFPMVLVDKIKKLGDGSDLLEPCISEYWTPTKNWKFLEFLSPLMTVIQVVTIDELLFDFKGTMNYDRDLELANKLFSQ
jgi:hypothetical protein